jgi:hypothetical protein
MKNEKILKRGFWYYFKKMAIFTETLILCRISPNFFAKFEWNVDIKNVQELNFC